MRLCARTAKPALVVLVLTVAACSAPSQSQPIRSATVASSRLVPKTKALDIPSILAGFNPILQRIGALNEAGQMNASTDPNWWLSSGGRLIVRNDVVQTIQGSLPENDPWRSKYASESATDSDNGAHPQNLFRLVSQRTFQQPRQEVFVRIDHLNLSKSSERDAWSGIFLMSAYAADGDTLYYTGIRMDGHAVIKKKDLKLPGDHYADPLAENTVFPGEYNRDNHPNLLPLDTWIGLRSTIIHSSSNSVTITLESDLGQPGKWRTVATAIDRHAGGIGPITEPGNTGIRTDFMDASFRNYSVAEAP